jgi:biopolymer transport protein TolQ
MLRLRARREGGLYVGFDILALILEAGLLVKLVLLVLAVSSAVSWAIIVFKWRVLSGAAEDSGAFLEVYHQRPLDAAYSAAHGLERSPLALIFLGLCGRLQPEQSGPGASDFAATEMRRLSRSLTWLAAEEGQRLERGLPFLATTGSSAPFIGLFGTVVGIIDAFSGIAAAGSASLAVVAPGIAEALIATAVGLLAAIPATIFYNIFVGRIDEIRSSIDLFSAELAEDLGAMMHGAASPGASAGRPG